MARTFNALALLLRYPDVDTRDAYSAAMEAIGADGLLPARIAKDLARLADELAREDLLDLQARYVQLFDRSRVMSLNLYEHVHGESRDRGQAMVELLKLYSAHGLELSARELPDHLPVFLEFLSTLDELRARALLGEASHVLDALRARLKKKRSPYAAVFSALVRLADVAHDAEALRSLMEVPEDDPDDLEALDRAWAEEPVTFGPDQSGGCSKAAALVERMKEAPA